MNIVAFILGIFLIFAISTNTLFKNNQNSKIIEKSFEGYMEASRKAYNKEEDNYFIRLYLLMKTLRSRLKKQVIQMIKIQK